MTVILKKLISAYHLVISPWLGTRCRFVPTCSEYAKQALDEHDVVTATMMTAKRICRCHPWGGHGFDPVSTKQKPKLETNNSDRPVTQRSTLKKNT